MRDTVAPLPTRTARIAGALRHLNDRASAAEIERHAGLIFCAMIEVVTDYRGRGFDIGQDGSEFYARPRSATVGLARELRDLVPKCRKADVGLRPPHSNPAKKIRMYRQGVRERFLSEEEIGKAADAIYQTETAGKIGPHAAAGLRLALFTGARSGEISAAQWSHVDWQRKQIRLPDSKTNVPRTIHLSDAAVEILKTLPRVGSFIIAGRYKNEPHQNLTRAWIIARVSGGLEDVRLHDLRHSYASLAAGRGVSLQMIGKLLGHKVAATTQRYAHLARDAVASVNDELGDLINTAIEKYPPTTGLSLKAQPK